jgi:hypothetical protein
VTVNLFNHGPYLSWSLVMGPLLLQGWREAPGNGIVLVAGFYFTMLFSTAGIILLFAAIRKLGMTEHSQPSSFLLILKT